MGCGVTAEQLTLTPHAPTRGTARRRDRATSVAAAHSVQPCTDQQRCLDALRLNGGVGSLDTVCAHFADLGVFRDRGSLSRRLSDLADPASGPLIVDTGEVVRGSRGRDITVWALA